MLLFVAAFQMSPRPGPTPLHAFRDVTKAIGSLLVPPPPPNPQYTIEGSSAFRTLGIPPNSKFEEVQMAVTRLQAKYWNDKKMLVKIEIAKDEIFDLRLKQRVSGEMTSPELAEDQKNAEIAEQKAKRAKLASRLPQWITDIKFMYYPPQKWRKSADREERVIQQKHLSNSKKYALGSLFIIVFVPFIAGLFKPFVSFIFFGHLINRGYPPVRRDRAGNVGEIRPPNYREIAYSALFVFGGSALFWVLGNWASPYMWALRPMQTRMSFVLLGCYLACTTFQPKQDVFDRRKGKTRAKQL